MDNIGIFYGVRRGILERDTLLWFQPGRSRSIWRTCGHSSLYKRSQEGSSGMIRQLRSACTSQCLSSTLRKGSFGSSRKHAPSPSAEGTAAMLTLDHVSGRRGKAFPDHLSSAAFALTCSVYVVKGGVRGSWIAPTLLSLTSCQIMLTQTCLGAALRDNDTGATLTGYNYELLLTAALLHCCCVKYRTPMLSHCSPSVDEVAEKSPWRGPAAMVPCSRPVRPTRG